MKQIETTFGQSVSDIAVQEYGCVEGQFAILIDNEFIGNLSVVFEPKTKLNIRTEKLKLNKDNLTISQMMVAENIGKIVGGLPTNMVINYDYVQVGYVDVDYVLEL